MIDGAANGLALVAIAATRASPLAAPSIKRGLC